MCRETLGSVLILLCFCVIKLSSFPQSSQNTYLICVPLYGHSIALVFFAASLPSALLP